MLTCLRRVHRSLHRTFLVHGQCSYGLYGYGQFRSLLRTFLVYGQCSYGLYGYGQYRSLLRTF